MKLTESRKAALQAGRETYYEAQRIAKGNAAYREYWNTVKKTKAHAKRLGIKLKLEGVYGEMQFEHKKETLATTTLAAKSLGISSEASAQQLFKKMVEAEIFKKRDSGLFEYKHKLYTQEDLILMCRAPKQAFKASEPVWVVIKQYAKALPNGKKEKKVAQEFFGS